jgi:origin recognition complex subunit 2
MKPLGNSQQHNTPTKKVLVGLTITDTPTKQIIQDDLERAEKENSYASPSGKELYSLQRKRNNLQKYTLSTPFALRSRKRVEAQNQRKQLEDSSDSEDIEEEEVRELKPTSHDSVFEKVSKSATSNNVLEFALQPGQYAAGLGMMEQLHVNEKASLISTYISMYPQFVFELDQGCNLLFYGYGSKLQLLSDFVDECLDVGPTITIHGYFPSISLKVILSKTLSTLFGYTQSLHSVVSQSKKIVELLRTSEYDYISFLVHNIEGKGLANDQSQQALAILAACEKIYLIASCDHFNTAMLWDHQKLLQFGFVWHDLTTFVAYKVETSFENSVIVNGKGKSGHGIIHVLRSLAQNARNLFLLLARHQLEDMDTTAEAKDGMSFDSLFQKCREGFYVNNMLTFRTLLTEFKDHECILSAQVNGSEYLYIPLRKDDLELVVEEAKEL